MRLHAVRNIFIVAALCLVVGLPLHADTNNLRVAAASDLTYAFSEIAKSYEKRTGEKVDFTFAASGLLARQIENGAPFDVFAAANTSYLEGLQRKKQIGPDDVHVYAIGHIGMYSRPGALRPPAKLAGLATARLDHIAIANPRVAPYGKAAEEALTSARILQQVQSKLVFGENIQQTMEFARSGNAEIAIVSASQGQHQPGAFVPVPDSLHKPIVQAIGVVGGSADKARAARFVAFVLGKEGQAILHKSGFSSPPRSSSDGTRGQAEK